MVKLKRLISCGTITAFFLAGCSGNKPQLRSADTIPVTTISLNRSRADSSGHIIYNGSLQAHKTIDLSFQVSGTITSISVKTGDHINKGQLIGSVDEATYRNQYNAQVAQVRLAEENYKRILAVYEKGSIAEIKMLEAKSNLEQLSANARASYQNIAHTRLFAPQSGYVGEKKVEAGATAQPGQVVLQLLDTRSVDVLVAVPEDEVNRYHQGDPADITIGALGDTQLKGIVSEVGVLALNNSANYNIKIKLSNTNRQLKPGMLCKVSFQSLKLPGIQSDSQLVVPLQAVQVDENGRNYVYIITPNHKAERREVRTGTLYDNGLAITSGLNGTERLVTSGYQKLADQAPVVLKP